MNEQQNEAVESHARGHARLIVARCLKMEEASWEPTTESLLPLYKELTALRTKLADMQKERDEWRTKHWNAHHHSQEMFNERLKEKARADALAKELDEARTALISGGFVRCPGPLAWKPPVNTVAAGLRQQLAAARTALSWIRNCADSDEGTYILISEKAAKALAQISPAVNPVVIQQRSESCVRCGKSTTDWIDTPETKGRCCRECESVWLGAEA